MLDPAFIGPPVFLTNSHGSDEWVRGCAWATVHKGPPAPTDAYSVEELAHAGMIGFYRQSAAMWRWASARYA